MEMETEEGMPESYQSRKNSMSDSYYCKGHSFFRISKNFPTTDLPYCNGCGNKIYNSTFACRNCGGVYHKSCTELPKQIQHSCDPNHLLNLIDTYPPGKDATSNFVYSCVSCNIELTVNLALQNPTIKLQLEGHNHYLFENNVTCSVCQIHSSSHIFTCVDSTCTQPYMHLHCVPLPFPDTIMHKSHWHPLTLTKSLPQDEHENEFYCDICEKERDPSHPLYCCKECENKGDFVAHMVCALSEVLPSLVAEVKLPTQIDEDPLNEIIERESQIFVEQCELECKLNDVIEETNKQREEWEVITEQIQVLESKRSYHMSISTDHQNPSLSSMSLKGPKGCTNVTNALLQSKKNKLKRSITTGAFTTLN